MSLLCLLLFVMPFHYDPRLGMTLLRAGVLIITPIKLLGVVTAAVALLAPKPKSALPHLHGSLVKLFLLFAIIPVGLTVARGFPVPTNTISQFISAMLLFVALIPMVKMEERLVKVVRALVLGFVCDSLWIYRDHFIHHVQRASGLEGDANYDCLMLLLALPLAFWMARHERRPGWRRAGLISGLLMAGAVVLTESRAGITAGGVLGLVAAMRMRRKLLGVTLLAFAAVMVLSFGPSGLSERFHSLRLSGNPENGWELSSRIHFELKKAGLRMIRAHPIFGVGLEQFMAVAPNYNPEILRLSHRHWVAHDTFIQIAAEAGIPALLLFVAMLGTGFQNARATQRSFDERLAALGLAMELSFVGIIIVAFSITAEFLPFCISILLSQSLREIAHAADTERSLIQRAAAAISRVPKRAA